MANRIIGIDLGTTNSCVAIMDGAEAVVLPNSEGARTTPSMVGFSESGERFVGLQAKRQAIINPARTIYGAKRLIGHRFRDPEVQHLSELLPYQITSHANGDAWVQVDQQTFSPQEVSAIVLAKMKATAEDFFGETVTEAVLTVPAYFNDAQRQATRDAGKIAGLNVRRIINEPTAAALAYGVQKREQGKIAVFDLGGGTFDVSILEIRGGAFKVLSTAGDNNLGGEDFDRAILTYLLDHFRTQTGLDISGDKMALQRIKEAAESAKCELSTLRETNINLPFLAVDDSGPQHLALNFTRSKLNDLVADLIDRLEEPCHSALREARTTAAELTDVLLVGGMTRMPLVQQKVEELFARKPSKSVNPDEVVAVGAAVQSAILGGELREVVLLDVTPMNLGLRTAGNRVSVLIEKNTPIPARAAKLCTSTEENHEFVSLHIVQGNSPNASENVSLGEFTLQGIPPAPAGQPRIEVTFMINSDGVVEVSAMDRRTMQKQTVTVQHQIGLDSNELRQAQERLL